MRRTQAGTTLVELLVAITIIGLCLSLMVGAFSTAAFTVPTTAASAVAARSAKTAPGTTRSNYNIALTSNTFHKTVEAYRQGAHTMPREYYTSNDILADERARLFPTMWHCAGRVSKVALAGDFIVRDIAGESIFVFTDWIA